MKRHNSAQKILNGDATFFMTRFSIAQQPLSFRVTCTLKTMNYVVCPGPARPLAGGWHSSQKAKGGQSGMFMY